LWSLWSLSTNHIKTLTTILYNRFGGINTGFCGRCRPVSLYNMTKTKILGIKCPFWKHNDRPLLSSITTILYNRIGISPVWSTTTKLTETFKAVSKFDAINLIALDFVNAMEQLHCSYFSDLADGRPKTRLFRSLCIFLHKCIFSHVGLFSYYRGLLTMKTCA